MVARGCGDSRVSGGIYACCPIGPHGKPIEHFLVDPPIPIDAKEIGLTPIGVKLIERDGVWHLMDWVGSVHYPNVGDYVEETRRFGLSRRLPTTLDFSKLTLRSRILLVHSRASFSNFVEYRKEEPEKAILAESTPIWKCPKNLPEHKTEGMCVRLWYQDVTEGIENPVHKRHVNRMMPAFEYGAFTKPDNVEPDYSAAIFASFPIINVAVVKDSENGTHERSMNLASKASVPVELVDE